MYKLIIVEDEKVICNGLKNEIEWSKWGFCVDEVFFDGAEALEYLRYNRPDVILTDVRMNRISGIEVAKYVSENRLPCKVILLSAHQEFEVAISAMSYGVVDFLLKPISMERFAEVFAKVKAQLDENQSREKNEKQREQALLFLREQFLEELIYGTIKDPQVIKKRFEIAFPDKVLEKTGCVLFVMKIKDFDSFLNRRWQYPYEQLEDSIKNFLSVYKEDGESYHLVFKDKEILKMIGLFEDAGAEFSQSAIFSMAEEMGELFGFQAEVQVTGLYRHLEEIGNQNGKNHEKEQEQILVSCLAAGNSEQARKVYEAIWNEIEGIPFEQCKKRILQIMSCVQLVLAEKDARMLESLKPLMELIRSEKTEKGSLGRYSVRIFDALCVDTNVNGRSGADVIQKAKDYIAKNIFRDISRDEVAEKTYVSSTHLSRLFRQETGEGFLQCMNRMKIEKSIELLNDPNLKLYEISEKMGYKTPRYFSRLFREQTGMTPKEYRYKVLSWKDYDEEKEI